MACYPNAYLCSADVPRDKRNNLLWRAWITQKATEDSSLVQYLWCCCAADFEFYVDSFVWTFNPRLQITCQPFILYGFQREVSEEIIQNIRDSQMPENLYRRFDLLIEKSRDMGVTWLVLLVFDWFWRFHGGTFRCISKKEDNVDLAGEPDALFQKLDYLEERLPPFLAVRGKMHNDKNGRRLLRVRNPNNDATINGESSNENAGRGGRNLSVMRDEEAFCDNGSKITQALNQTTRVQIRLSTPNGKNNSYATARFKSKGGCKVITLHWSLHPDKARGLYSIKGGKVEILDKDWHEKNPGYDFQISETYADPGTAWEFLRSPWFDGECAAADSPLDIAQELQISYSNTGSPYFDPNQVSALQASYQKEPYWQGDLKEIMPILEKIVDRDSRPCRAKVWYDFSSFAAPGNEHFCAGADISAGTLSSDSVLSIASTRTGRKVFEFSSNGITPEDFARVCFEIVKKFKTSAGSVYYGWDQGGPGRAFGTKTLEMYEMDYDRHCEIYYDLKDTSSGDRVESTIPGVNQAGTGKKESLFSSFRSALYSGDFVTPSKNSYTQIGQFIYKNGRIVHSIAASTDNGSAKGEQHGDVVSSEIILWKVISRFREDNESIATEEQARPERVVSGQELRYQKMLKDKRSKERSFAWWSQVS